jgi:hypothetical protein
MSTSPATDVRRSVQDVAYTAVGVGVLGAQQAAQLSQQAVDAAKAQVSGVRAGAKQQADDVKVTAKSTADSAKSRVEDLVHDVRERVEPLVTSAWADVWTRVEPVIEQIQEKADEVVTAGTAKARALLGKDAPASTETRAA